MPFNDEVEKIVSAACISFIDNGMTCDGAIRSALRAYGEWLAKKRCSGCEAGIERRFGYHHVPVFGVNHERTGTHVTSCDAADIWESLEEK